MNTEAQKKLIEIAHSYIGTVEVGGDNKGPQVEEFQKAVDGKAQRESWCMCAVQFWVKKTATLIPKTVVSLFASEHCLTVWNKTDVKYRAEKPKVGHIVIWQYYKNGKATSSGHTGVITWVAPDGINFKTVEGNTGPGSEVVREGDGVYSKSRSHNGTKSMKVVGYLNPFAE